ncbi:transporter substrate-binding domain-containing protein [Phenylobacterium montanum]|uniref:Transporter substrate-binding domain-containing protein n=1 Tax=Phenylobacterium montanum TaxID=2823693 RepID=A0A975FZE3_9CAUL|nr:transporter substrate-binding domain-containing protein [Caulobacter sp. S6]QUD87774.1 transporter substrate-binding domain-containing protein [Caulobacter sp. S6]
MRKFLVAALLALGTLTATMAEAGATLNRVMATKTLKVATNGAWPPQSFLDDRNQLVGFDIDVANEVARRLGVKTRFDTPDWATMTGGHWHGRWDVAIGSITPTKARSQVVSFASVYYYSPYVFVVHRNSKARTAADLNGKKIGVETATTSEDYIRRRLAIDDPGAPPVKYLVNPGQVHTYADSMLPFDDLRLGDGVRIDAVLAPEQTALRAIKSGYPIKIIPNTIAYKEPLAIVTDKDDPQWTAKLHDVIQAMRADGTLGNLTRKWYGRDYTQ